MWEKEGSGGTGTSDLAEEITSASASMSPPAVMTAAVIPAEIGNTSLFLPFYVYSVLPRC